VNRRNVFHLVAMVVLGLVAFGAFGAAVEWRDGRLLDPPHDVDTAVSGAAPAEVLLRGVTASAEITRDGLDGGHRSDAMRALDAAVRASRVGVAAGSGPLAWAFDHAWRQLEATRVSVETGHPGAARDHLDTVIQTMNDAARFAGTDATTLPANDDWDRYRGATVINAMGVRIGELDDVEVTADGPTATVTLGGNLDVFGFIDVGGDAVRIDATQLLYGQPRSVGIVHVVLPVFGDRPA
jgi:hypothetical protein